MIVSFNHSKTSIGHNSASLKGLTDWFGLCSDVEFIDDNHRVHAIGGYPSQMNLKIWLNELKLDSGFEISRFIAKGVLCCFSIVVDTDIPSYFVPNYKSATQGDAKIFFDELFKKELSECKYVKSQVIPHCVHAIGGVPKGPNQIQPYTDCRRPLGVSINHFMSLSIFYQYFKFQTFIANMFMASIDIAAAYCTICVKVQHWKYQGVCWDFSDSDGVQFLRDTHLCFGLTFGQIYFFSIK